MRQFFTTPFDIVDDKGALFREMYPSLEDVPDFIKKANVPDQSANPNLFALVMVEDGKVMKKFATADKGSTWLSLMYFQHTYGNLPEEATKVAAANLLEACEAYDIEADFLQDMAKGDPVKTNVVNVSTMKPPMQKVAHEDAHTIYAVTSTPTPRYPIGDMKGVIQADEYFETHVDDFEPPVRREFAVAVASQAKRYGLSVGDAIDKYAGEQPRGDFESHLTARGVLLQAKGADLDTALKLAAFGDLYLEADREKLASELYKFDVETGLTPHYGRSLEDPWSATFQPFSKVASENQQRRWTVGVETLTETALRELCSLNGKGKLIEYFGSDLANRLETDPVGAFEKLSLPQKQAIVYMTRE